MQANRQDIREVSAKELKAFLQENGEKAFRAKQIDEWLWQKHARSFEEMTNLSKTMRQLLHEHFELKYIRTQTTQLSEDGTLKAAFETYDHKNVEGVLIPSNKRLTACLSSQIGCSLNCTFCATGRMGLKRNLTHWEIYDQLVELQKIAEEHYGQHITNIVFMGMGEPFLNYDNTLKAIERMSSEKGLGISPRRITVSTVGLVKYIRQLAEDNPKVQLAISLHSADPEKRTELMPVNKSNGIDKLIEALKFYHEKTGNRITFEYVLMKDINDQQGDAWQLADFCRNFPSKVNLIEYNEVEGIPFEKSPAPVARQFKDFLESRNMVVNFRNSKGEDIDAACGQLANRLKHKNPE